MVQSAKTAALGPRRDLEALPSILTDPMLSRFQSEAAQAEETGWFWKYKVNSVQVCLLLFHAGWSQCACKPQKQTCCSGNMLLRKCLQPGVVTRLFW